MIGHKQTGAGMPIQFSESTGSPVTVGHHRHHIERIREAMVDLQVVLIGYEEHMKYRSADAMASLARHGSMFLRKLVIGDGTNQSLLSNDICRELGISFSRLRKIENKRHTLTLAPVPPFDGEIIIQEFDSDKSKSAGDRTAISFGKHQFTVHVEWPLPGMADWIHTPTKDSPWKVETAALFEPESNFTSDCNRWLGQQLVMFDDRGITLKDMIRVLANTEAAHAPPVNRLMKVRGIEDKSRFRVDKDSHIHILSHLEVGSLRYSHIIVIEIALYVYQKLLQTGKFSGVYKRIPPIAIATENKPEADILYSSNQRLVRLQAGLMVSLGGSPNSISHRIKAPRA